MPLFEPYEDEPRGGLAGFFSSPDAGAEISDRLGGIAEILMRLGSGQGGQGLAAMQGGINDRSAARRDRRKMERMVRRAADKIAPSNPEMAAMMYANPEYGMQILGKKYESEWDNKARLAQIGEEYKLRGANEIATEREKQRLIAEQAQLDYERIWGKDGGATTGGGGGYDPWGQQAAKPITQTDTAAIAPEAPTPPAVPRGVDPVTQQPLMGEGSEPAPSQTPVPQPVVSQPEQSAPVEEVAQPEPISAMPEPPPLSSNPAIAARQKNLSRQLGVPVAEWGVKAMLSAHGKGGATETAVINNIQQDWARQVADHRKTAIEDRRRQEDVIQKQKDAEAQANLERQQAGLREQEFLGQVKPMSGSRGALSMGQKQPYELDQIPDPSLPNRAILRNQQFSDEDINTMQNPDMQAETILASQRAGGAQPAATLQAAQTALDKRRGDMATEAKATVVRNVTQRAAERIKSTLLADTGGVLSPQQERALAQLDVIALNEDPDKAAKALDDWTDTQGTLFKNAKEIAAKETETSIALSKEAREQAEYEAKAGTEKQRTRDEKLFTLGMAKDAQDSLDQMIAVVQDPNSRAIYGLPGEIAGLLAGTSKQKFNAFAETARSYMALAVAQKLKKYSATGGSPAGNASDQDMARFETAVTSMSALATTEEGAEYAIKKLSNELFNTFTPDSGVRYDMQAPGFQKRAFDMERDNYPLFILNQQENTITTPKAKIVPGN